MRFASILVSLAVGVLALHVAALEIETSYHALRASDFRLMARDGSAFVEIADGPLYRVLLKHKHITFEPGIPDTGEPPSAEALPGAIVSKGAGSIRSAWLAAPTERYDHGVLGDAIEAGAVVAELLVVKSSHSNGAALTLLAVRGSKLVAVAEASAIGMAHRWLNPVGVADFDVDGEVEAAAVITPHIGGTLKLYEWRGNRLVEDHTQFGFSNHAIGSRELGLAAVSDVNGDKVPDIVVPDAGRRNLLAVTFAQGAYRELARWPIIGWLTTAVLAADIDGDGDNEIVYGDGDRRLNVIAFAP